jgi:phospholipase C
MRARKPLQRRPKDPRSDFDLSRRQFLKDTAIAAGMLALAPVGVGCGVVGRTGGHSLRKSAAADCRAIEHVIVLMQENRSFDHYFGWLTHTNQQTYLDDSGDRSTTYALSGDYQDCGHADPDHSWEGGRAQLTRGFGSASADRFALGYYVEADVPFYAALAREFVLCDNYFCSVLGPTYPNRGYMHSAQSGGLSDNSTPLERGYADGFLWPTIWDRLEERGISWGYYFVDLPVVALWGKRLAKGARSISDFYTDAAAGTLPAVSFVDPGFTTELHTDEHPFGDIRAGQSFTYSVTRAIISSPAWQRAALFLNYDEWGGFFDSVAVPPRAADDRASESLANDFAQLGFRVPCTVVSPYTQRGVLASRLASAGRFYDHTSILKFIESRFGLPSLTSRDRAAADIGELFDFAHPAGVDRDELLQRLPRMRAVTQLCETRSLAGALSSAGNTHDFEHALHDGFFERMGFRISLPKLADVLAI